MSEKDQSEIRLYEISASVMGVLLDFCYTETVNVSVENVQELLPAACLLQLTGLPSLSLSAAVTTQEKKSETELTAGIRKKKKKNQKLTEALKMLLDDIKQESMQIFEGILFFKATKKKKTDNLADASLVLPEGCVFIFVVSVALKKRIFSKICILPCLVLLKKVFRLTFCVFLICKL